MDNRRRAAEDLEARIAQLDERLRVAKAVQLNGNSANSNTNNNGPVSAGAHSIPAAAGAYAASPLPKTTAAFAGTQQSPSSLSPTPASNTFTTNSVNMSAAASAGSASDVFNRSGGLAGGAAAITPARYPQSTAHHHDYQHQHHSHHQQQQQHAHPHYQPPQQGHATPSNGNGGASVSAGRMPQYDSFLTTPLLTDPNRLGTGVRTAAATAYAATFDGVAQSPISSQVGYSQQQPPPPPATPPPSILRGGGGAGGSADTIYGVPSVPSSSPAATTRASTAPFAVNGHDGLNVTALGGNSSLRDRSYDHHHHHHQHQQQQHHQHEEQQQQIVGGEPTRNRHTSGFEAFSSPWREAAFRTQIEANAELQKTATATRERRLDAIVSDVEQTNRNVAEADAQLQWYAARRDATAAETHRYLRETNDRVAALERAEATAAAETAELRRAADETLRQLSEVRANAARAGDRARALAAEGAALKASVKGAAEAEGAAAAAEADWHEHHSAHIIAPLRRRVAVLSDEVRSAKERLTAREGTLAASRAAGSSELKALAAEAAAARALLADMAASREAVASDLASQRAQSAAAAERRQQSAAEAHSQRAYAAAEELRRAKADNAATAAKAKANADGVVSQLNEEVEGLRDQIAKASAAREAVVAENIKLTETLASLEAAAAAKEAALPLCEQQEADVAALLSAREANAAHLASLQRDALACGDDVRALEVQSARLAEALDEESRLKVLLASLSQEAASATALRMEDSDAREAASKALEAAHTEALASVAIAENECHRIKTANAATLDSLTRKLHAAREGLVAKEARLDELLAKNTQLQNTIIQYEEEKRRMERDAMSRKEAASRAAKAALLDLA